MKTVNALSAIAMPKKPGDKMAPQSLANLAPYFSKENAKEMQARGVEKRKANAKAREHLKMNMKDWRKYKDEVLDEVEMDSLDVLRILMYKALDADDMDTAADLAKSIAEFEKPKLARVESKIEEVKLDDLSDEELDQKIRQLRIVK